MYYHLWKRGICQYIFLLFPVFCLEFGESVGYTVVYVKNG